MAAIPLRQRAIAETLGTFLLVFIGAGSIVTTTYFYGPSSSQLLLVALAHGIALALAVSIAMGISGGHINPAITVAMLATKRIKPMEGAVYILSQIIGAVIGAGLLLALPIQAVMLSGFGAPSLSSNISIWQGIIIEAAITFVLASAVFGTVVDKRAPKIAGFGVGLALFIGILVAGPFTGAAANPARALGPEIVSLNFTNWYVYWIGPILGALIAALLYQYFLLDTKSKTRSS